MSCTVYLHFVDVRSCMTLYHVCHSVNVRLCCVLMCRHQLTRVQFLVRSPFLANGSDLYFLESDLSASDRALKTEAWSSDTCSSMSVSTERNFLRQCIIPSSSSREYWREQWEGKHVLEFRNFEHSGVIRNLISYLHKPLETHILYMYAFHQRGVRVGVSCSWWPWSR